MTTEPHGTAPFQILPAHPGYSLLDLHEDQVFREPIIAWRVYEASAEPITLDPLTDVNHQTEKYAVQLPDGSVHTLIDASYFPDVQSWKTFMSSRTIREAKT